MEKGPQQEKNVKEKVKKVEREKIISQVNEGLKECSPGKWYIPDSKKRDDYLSLEVELKSRVSPSFLNGIPYAALLSATDRMGIQIPPDAIPKLLKWFEIYYSMGQERQLGELLSAMGGLKVDIPQKVIESLQRTLREMGLKKQWAHFHSLLSAMTQRKMVIPEEIQLMVEEGFREAIRKGDRHDYPLLLSAMVTLKRKIPQDQEIKDTLIGALQVYESSHLDVYCELVSSMVKAGGREILPPDVKSKLEKILDRVTLHGSRHRYPSVISALVNVGMEIPNNVYLQIFEPPEETAEFKGYAASLPLIIETGIKIPENMRPTLISVLERCAREGLWDEYGALVSSMVKAGIKIPQDAPQKLMEGLQKYANDKDWPAYASLLSCMADLRGRKAQS